MGIIESLIGSIFAGGATGLLGAAIQRFFDYKNARLQLDILRAKQAHELVMRDKDLAIMKEEYAGRFKIADREAVAAENVAAETAFAQSLFKEPERYTYASTLTVHQQWLMVLLDVARGIVRPGLTVYLCVLVTYIWYIVRELIKLEDLQPGEVLEIWKLVVATILYVWTTVTLWWFGTRNKQQPPRALR